MEVEELLTIARRDFTEVKSKKSPARVKNLQVRFYIDKFVEHEKAFEFLSDTKQTYGEGPKTLIRALLYYRDTVIIPIAEAKDNVPTELRLLQLDFTPQQKRRSSRVKGVSIRLYVDTIAEHKEAYEFLQNQNNLHGDGQKTVIRALNHYKKNIIDPLSLLDQGKLL